MLRIIKDGLEGDEWGREEVKEWAENARKEKDSSKKKNVREIEIVWSVNTFADIESQRKVWRFE